MCIIVGLVNYRDDFVAQLSTALGLHHHHPSKIARFRFPTLRTSEKNIVHRQIVSCWMENTNQILVFFINRQKTWLPTTPRNPRLILKSDFNQVSRQVDVQCISHCRLEEPVEQEARVRFVPFRPIVFK